MLSQIENCLYKGYKEIIRGDNFTLKENNTNSKCREAKFTKSGDILVYKFDKTPKKDSKEIKDIFPFFEDLEKLKAICDFIIFYEKIPKILSIILCNLKSSNKDNSPDQLKAGEIFSDFIISNARRIYPENFEHVVVNKYKILFSAKLLYKTPTHPRNYNPSNPKNYVSNDTEVEICHLDNLCRH